jgi:predicted transcriptional regulator
MDDVTVAGILHALADPVRLGIVQELRTTDSGMNCVETIGKVDISMPKSTCSLHFQILREAGLIRSERKGIELSSQLRLDELNARFPGLIDCILQAHNREKGKHP